MKDKRKASWTEEQLKKAVSESKSKAGVLRKLGLVPIGGNYRTINKYIEELNLDTSHFTGQGWNVGSEARIIKPAEPLSEILTKDHPYQSFKLKQRLIKENLKEEKCECCGKSEWCGKPIPLELHHINGDHSDNRIENLQILCPNCHALTDNYRGKAAKKGASARKEISDVETG